MNPGLRTPPPARSRRAFLLWEVLIASAVFAIAVTGLALALNRLIDANLAATREQRMRTELESRFAMARVDPELQPGATTTERDADGIEYVRTVEEFTPENEAGEQLAGILKVTIRARKGEEALATASLLLLRQ